MTNDFGYNDRSEVIGALMGTNSYGYAYDPIGNRLTAANNGEALTYHANLLNQYTSISNGAIIEPQYDEDGNMTASGDGWTYVWNADNRMILASNGTTVVTCAYDYQGRRVAKTVNGSVRQYLWDGWNMVAEARASETNWYVWGLDLSQSLQGAGGVGGLLATVFSGDPELVEGAYAFDGNGNVSELVGTNGTTLAHYEYDPFGNLTTETGAMAASNPFRFSSKYWDGDTKLAYYGYRYYSPGMGRWVSRDPFWENGGINLFVFLQNSTINSIDVLGLARIWPIIFLDTDNFIEAMNKIYSSGWYQRQSWEMKDEEISKTEDVSLSIDCKCRFPWIRYKYTVIGTYRNITPEARIQMAFWTPKTKQSDNQVRVVEEIWQKVMDHEMIHNEIDERWFSQLNKSFYGEASDCEKAKALGLATAEMKSKHDKNFSRILSGSAKEQWNFEFGTAHAAWNKEMEDLISFYGNTQ